MPPHALNRDPVRRRVLASAYACEPGQGSEPGIGWNWARQIALHHELTLITRENNVDAVRAAAAAEALPMRVVGHDLAPSLRFWKKGSRGAMAYYYLWQRSLGKVARGLAEEHTFDVAHHLTFASGWLPSGFAGLDLPFVFGPVGEHPRVPATFVRKADFRARLSERVRAVARGALPKLDRSVQATWRAADVVLSLGETFGLRAPAGLQDKMQPMLACGVNASSFREPIPRATDEPMRVLFAGRLVDMKGARIALQAFALAQRQLPMTLEVLGDGPLRGELERMAAAIGPGPTSEPIVQFRGRVSHSETTEAMARAHVFLFPSFEGAGMVVPEAMAAGAMVLSLDEGGPGEMVKASGGAAVPTESSVEATASALAKVLQKAYHRDAARLDFAERGQEWARRAATWESKGKALSDIYGLAIDRHHGVSSDQATGAEPGPNTGAQSLPVEGKEAA